ncbi:hypothetical protein CEE37_03375 [candidate division LCP-89 bacterium B3_LCP]|uniref:Uncharacterized protein n=1 Tax=candidate division LCP-89 bacterium B3_LCP TaxID=2012998 RepID=A0A532V324_UNCL8|nr:MAG: hypothetical protein CEE37_03375 [candidate division LCP-89 bacterium B3_LCP]
MIKVFLFFADEIAEANHGPALTTNKRFVQKDLKSKSITGESGNHAGNMAQDQNLLAFFISSI